jgi:hypothetical protein
MTRRPARVTQAEIARVLRAAAQTRLPVVVLIEPEGTIRIVPATEADKSAVAKVKDIVL